MHRRSCRYSNAKKIATAFHRTVTKKNGAQCARKYTSNITQNQRNWRKLPTLGNAQAAIKTQKKNKNICDSDALLQLQLQWHNAHTAAHAGTMHTQR